MKILFTTLAIACLGAIQATQAETRIWTMQDGRTMEAELLTVISGSVKLKTLNGNTISVPVSAFSEPDQDYIALSSPPRLGINVSYKTETRIFPESFSELPRSLYYELTATVEQKSTLKYEFPLTIELFTVGEWIHGPVLILLDYKKESFTLNGSNSRFELKSDRVELATYVISNQNRGQKYKGYLAVVTDKRGEVIAHATTREDWFEYVDNLREVPEGKSFDDECKRRMPPRPQTMEAGGDND